MNENDPCRPCENDVIEKFPPCPLQCRTSKCKAYNAPGLDSKPIIWVLGGPGSGKTTQCAKMVAKYGFMHVSVAELLKAEVQTKSVRAKCVAKAMSHGETVPNDVVLDLLKETIRKNIVTSKGFLIDGFPKEKIQGIAFEKRIAPSTEILYLDASPGTLKTRLMEHAAAAGHKDDTEETISKRLKIFAEHKLWLLEEYKDRVHMINADRHPEEIFPVVQRILDGALAKP